MKGKKSIDFIRKALEVHDFDRFCDYHCNTHSSVQYSQPHQFRFRKFNNTVLLHYKMWAADGEYLPNIYQIQPSSPDDLGSLQSLPKRKFVRGASKTSTKRFKLAQKQKDVQDHDSEEAADNNVAPDEVHPAGIQWLISYPSEQNPCRVQVPDSKKIENAKNASSLYDYIVQKSKFAHPELFSDDVLSNWESWMHSQVSMWTDSVTYCQKLPQFTWMNHYQSRAVDIAESVTEVLPSERQQPPPGTELIFHDSGAHGKFSDADRVALIRQQHVEETAVNQGEVMSGKAVIYKWLDDEDGNTYIWVAMVKEVKGNPESSDCELIVLWCPNQKTRNPQYRARISENDIFDVKYTQTRGPTKKYIMTIERQSCIAINLELSKSGKFDSKSRHGCHFGATSKEVARVAINEFYFKTFAKKLLNVCFTALIRKAFAKIRF